MRRLLLVLGLLYGLAACKEQSDLQLQAPPLNFDHTLLLNQQPIKVVVLDTPAEREQGLMGVKALPKGQGALFVFEQEGEVGFWMKHTFLPLSLLFFNKQRQLVKVIPSLQPCQTAHCEIVNVKNTQFVLELEDNALTRQWLSSSQNFSFTLQN